MQFGKPLYMLMAFLTTVQSLTIASSSVSYENPFTIYLTMTNSLGVITGMPSVYTSQPSVITSQPVPVTVYPGGPGYSAPTPSAPSVTVVVPPYSAASASASMPVAATTGMPTLSSGVSLSASAPLAESTGAAAVLQAGLGGGVAAMGLGGLFAALF